MLASELQECAGKGEKLTWIWTGSNFLRRFICCFQWEGTKFSEEKLNWLLYLIRAGPCTLTCTSCLRWTDCRQRYILAISKQAAASTCLFHVLTWLSSSRDGCMACLPHTVLGEQIPEPVLGIRPGWGFPLPFNIIFSSYKKSSEDGDGEMNDKGALVFLNLFYFPQRCSD